jgi:hypothetical protein
LDRPKNRLSGGIITCFGILLCLLTGVILAGQITGFLNIYYPLPVILLSLLITVIALFFYFRWDALGFIPALRQKNSDQQKPRALNWAAYAAGLAIFFLLVLFPLIRWPFSTVSDVLHWDTGAYHFPKAIELYKSETFWDLSIPYGEYPNGFESLLSFGLLVRGDELLFGTVHALVAVLMLLSIWMLARRYTCLPGGLIFLFTSLIFISGLIQVANNPWWIFTDHVFMIGKNDMLVSAAVLGAVLHAPIGGRDTRSQWHLPGLVFSTAIVLAVKPVGVYALLPLWLLVAYRWVRPLFQRPAGKLPWKEALFSGLIILPSLLWVLRNYLVLGVIFPPSHWEMAEWSIANNLSNPFFYNYLPKLFLFVLGVIVFMLVLAAWRKSPDMGQVFALLVLFAAFVLTPQTAFFGSTDKPTHIAWRFGMSLLGYLFVLFLVVLDPMLNRALSWLSNRRRLALLAALFVLLYGAALVWQYRGMLRILPNNDIVLRDQFRESVGVDGYFSAYDYVRKNIRDADVQIEGGLMYYVYGEDLSNRPTKLQYPIGMDWAVPQRNPQYYVILCTDFWNYRPEECPAYLEHDSFTAHWRLRYIDDYGRVFERLP